MIINNYHHLLRQEHLEILAHGRSIYVNYVNNYAYIGGTSSRLCFSSSDLNENKLDTCTYRTVTSFC